jgi:hypothetical protein
VKFDHDFIGRQALEAMGTNHPRQKVTLAWNGEDVVRAMGTLFQKENRAKYIDLPLSNYSTWPNDRIMKDGKMVGRSTFSGYSSNESSMLSLGVVDNEVAEPGTEVTLVWGEEGGGSRKPVVERRADRDPRHRLARAVRRGRPRVVPADLTMAEIPSSSASTGRSPGRWWSISGASGASSAGRPLRRGAEGGLCGTRHLARRPRARARDGESRRHEARAGRQRLTRSS